MSNPPAIEKMSDNLSDTDTMNPEEEAKRKTELAYQIYFLVIKQATEDLEKKLKEYGKSRPALR